VFAVSVAVGIAGVPWQARIRLGLAFSFSEVAMQLIGFFVGSRFLLIGAIAAYVGFAILAWVGIYMVSESYSESYKEGEGFRVDSNAGLVATSLSISMDSLGVGFALPGVPLPLIPLISTVACSTIVFTFIGLAFGSRLGARLGRGAERTAGFVLFALAVLFTAQHLLRVAV
jgi:manganese efflux pump family protein